MATKTETAELVRQDSILSIEQMDAIDKKVAELKEAFDNGNEMSAEDCKLFGYIRFHERAQTFEPEQFVIRQFDVIKLMKKYHVIESTNDNYQYSREEDRQLRGYLLQNWKKLTFNDKVVFHALNGSLPHWGFMYPPIPEWVRNAESWINSKPE